MTLLTFGYSSLNLLFIVCVSVRREVYAHICISLSEFICIICTWMEAWSKTSGATGGCEPEIVSSA